MKYKNECHKTQYILTLILTICSMFNVKATIIIHIIYHYHIIFKVLFIMFILKLTWLLFRDSSPSSQAPSESVVVWLLDQKKPDMCPENVAWTAMAQRCQIRGRVTI